MLPAVPVPECEKMKIPRWLIRKPDFTLAEFWVWAIVVGATVAIIPSLWGFAVGVALGFIVVIPTKSVINSIRLTPRARRIFHR